MSARGGTKKDLIRTIRNLQAENLKLELAIRRASGEFFRDRPDGEIAARMFKILGEVEPPNDKLSDAAPSAALNTRKP